MIEQQLELATGDGVCTTFVVHPERGGPHPLVLFYMDAPGIREELRDMARRLASVGYFVMLPNLYYRQNVMELGPLPVDPKAPERARMFALMHTVSIAGVLDDTRALLAWAGTQPAARTDRIGCVGYCMSGQFATNVAANFPERVRAAASIYGTELITDRPDSPHVVAARAKAEFYFACAGNDVFVPPEIPPALRAALARDGVNAEVEDYPGQAHGFAFASRPGYHKPSAERHWERLFALFARRLA